jgi:pimeloyl-ACP methyl ester carboxylesterase
LIECCTDHPVRSGDSYPGFQAPKYSWIDYASTQGYPTLSIDRLGNGLSDHPDPILVAQTPLNAKIVNEIGVLALAGTLPDPTLTGTKFSKVILVGHSEGSVIANVATAQYPKTFTGLILTGFSTVLDILAPPIIALLLPLPADTAQPSRFGNLPAGYLFITNTAGRQQEFFHAGGYDPAIFTQDALDAGTMTVGEAATLYLTPNQAPGFTGPVLALNGLQDAVFCSVSAPGVNVGDCSSLTSKVSTLYPNAKVFNSYNVGNTGHCINLHYNATLAFQVAHDFMNANI